MNSNCLIRFCTDLLHHLQTFLGLLLGLYIGWAKEVSRKLLSISSPNIDNFSHFFHRHILWKVFNKTVTNTYHTLTAVLYYLVKYKSVKSIDIWWRYEKGLERNFLVHPIRQYRLLTFTNTGSVSKAKHNST